MTDTECLDWLEKFVNEHGALVLHTGEVDCGKHLGLGLRPGLVRRTLREAIETAAGAVTRAKPKAAKP